jgi:DNA-binding IclR family transcriptional regulator
MIGVPALERGISILRMFTRDRTRIAAPDVARELGIPRSTVHRLLTSLVDLGLLRCEAGALFALGPGVLSLGFEYLASLDIGALSNPILMQLRDQINCSTHLAIRVGTRVVYLSRYASSSPVSSSIGVGSSLPAHATIMGRILLSALRPEALRSLYGDGRLEPAGKKGPKTLKALEELIAADRKRGYAISTGYFDPGVTTIAAPVFDSTSTVVAAINATSAAGAFDKKALNGKLKDKVLAAAREISTSLNAPQTLFVR